MGLSNIVVRTIEYGSDNELYVKLNEFMEYKGATAVQRMRVVQLQVIEEGKAVAYLEPDQSVMQVRFFVNGDEVGFPEAPRREVFLPMEQINMIDHNGELRLCNRGYEVQSIVYCMDDAGIPFVEIELE